jgi:ribosomal-protein-alanine N-acetyltransferase
MTHGYLFRQMDVADAREISGWRYDPPYDFYDSTADLAELLDPQSRTNVYFSALDGENRLVGFSPFEKADEAVDVGLGLRPELTGRGLGAGFVLAGLAFARERFSPQRFTLSVATFYGRDRRLRARRFSAGRDPHARDQRRRARVPLHVARDATRKRPHGRRFAGPGAVRAWCLPRLGRG